MELPSPQALGLDPGILSETDSGGNRLVVWLPARHPDGAWTWERIGSVARAPVSRAGGLCSTPATSIPARERPRGFSRRLLTRLRRESDAPRYTLPGGVEVESCGPRKTDLLLVWPADLSRDLDEPLIRSKWPEAREVGRIGSHLFVVRGVERAVPAERPVEHRPRPEATAPQPSDAAAIDQSLGQARRVHDRRAEAQALVDLGALHLREGRPQDAMGPLLEAIEIAGSIDELTLQGDAMLELGLSALALQEPANALEAFEYALRLALASGSPYAEKLARDRVALAHSTLGHAAQALVHLERALALARQLGDRRHEGYLLWYTSIQHADLGRHEHAADLAKQAVEIMGSMGNPEGAWYNHHLGRYTAGDGASVPGGGGPGQGPILSTDLDRGGTATQESRAGILRMAATATAAMARFVRSGFQTLPTADHQARLQVCSTCEHYTGTRCRLCGCFMSLKARLNHERCPLNKWPS